MSTRHIFHASKGVLCLIGLGLTVLASSAAARDRIALFDGWLFTTNDSPDAVRADPSAWRAAQVPHTWNAVDGADGADGGARGNKSSYRRGAGWYALELPVPKLGNDRRAFLKFNGASVVADVYLNGTHLGQHRGAFGAFGFEVTTYLNSTGKNDLRVRVDNSWQADVAPLAGDFTVFGGLYRPVELLITSDVCIDPLDYAAPGVAVFQNSVTRERAEIEVAVSVSRSSGVHEKPELVLTVRDAAGQLAQRERRPVLWQSDHGGARFSVAISNPHLWHGVRDPYLYSVGVELVAGDHVLDRVEQPLGLRAIRVDLQRGFLLNDEPYPLRGVCRHQDREGKGWAVTPADEAEDIVIIRDVGANALRLAHYQHSDSFLELCDRQGLLVWAEIPLVNKVRNTPGFHANAEQQLVELIRQQRNHPSVAMWGLFNELYHQGPTDPCEPLVARLQAIAKREDPTRLTTAASNQLDKRELNGLTDLIACNIYPGWYGRGEPSQMGAELNRWLAATDGRGLGVSEYGAGASPNQHEERRSLQPDPGGRWHPEEYQSFCHEEQYRQIHANAAVWGSFVWNAFDFGSDERAEGEQDGINDKGLVSYDRKVRKDAFYFYKANWNAAPMVHLNSRRFAVRKARLVNVRAYSNCDTVDLVVNGRSIGVVKPDASKVVAWPAVELRDGDNSVEAIGRAGTVEVRDQCAWQFRSASAEKAQSASISRDVAR